MKNLFFILIFFLSLLTTFAQKSENPKLVVGIVVDQMRYDYLEKFYNDFGENGFKRIINGGTNFTNCKINYIPTVTGAGHASIYTGTTPYFHGIIANDWKDRKTFNNVNCVTTIRPTNKIYSEGISKKQSPDQLLSTTIGDQIKLNYYGKCKVISISIKDRAAILPAGFAADAAYWFNEDNGKFITSYHYMNKLPNWVTNFNNSGKVDSYIKKEWTLFKPTEVYKNLLPDNSPYETDVFDEGRTSFPHSFKNVLKSKTYEKLVHTPFGNQILIDFIKETLANENLGKGNNVDFLAISFSTPDKIGHDYGLQSYELKDNYLRLDAQLAELLNMLDAQVGKGNYLLFLTADHGAMDNTQLLKDMHFNAGVLESTNYYDGLLKFLSNKYGSDSLIAIRFSRNIYLNYDILEKLKLNPEEVERTIKDYLLYNVPAITEVYTRSELEGIEASRYTNNYLLNGFNKKRSGDVVFSLRANYLNSPKDLGAQHGSRHEYDSHIPLIFYGTSIPKSTRNEKVYIVDIAATVCDLIHVEQPSDCIGIPLFKK